MTRPSRILSAPTLGRALAEIAIIVAGVLIALGADAWWTEREERETLQNYVARIADDVDADLRTLERGSEREGERMETADRLIERMKSPTEPPRDSIRGLINGTRGGTTFPLRTGTWLDLSSTGRLALIEDPSLRYWIIEYYNTLVPVVRLGTEDKDRFQESLFRSMMPHLDDRAVFAQLGNDPDAPILVTSWDAFRTDPVVGAELRALSAIARDESRALREWLRATECVRIALYDAGAPWEVEPEFLTEIRERCPSPAA